MPNGPRSAGTFYVPERPTKRRSARHNQAAFLEAFIAHGDIRQACETAGVTQKAYQRWRERFPEFKAKVDSARVGLRERDSADPDVGFADFRLRFFGMASPWFHLEIIDAYENTPPGNITLILVPPEHGKTTLFEDYACYKLALIPDYRFVIGSESQALSRKVLARLKNRMSADGPFPEFVIAHGPFTPPEGESAKSGHVWSADYFNVWKKGGHDERDYSAVALGFGSQIAGTRTDHLHVDDPQSLKSLGQTETMLDTFRQDWLTRPGEKGRTTINGTRVGEDDFYAGLMEALPPDILRVIRYPAIITDNHTGEVKQLWEDRYSMEELERMHVKVGDDAWSRNYMQQPRSAHTGSFDERTVDPCLNEMRSLDDPPPTNGYAVLSLDPALHGMNCLSAWQFETKKLSLLDIWERQKLTSWEQIFANVEDALHRISRNGTRVTDLVIETMAFQKGLARDERLLELRDRWGFSIREHLTGFNKYDENIGIPSMVTSFNQRHIDLPWAGDDRTRHEVGELRRQLFAWRPLKRGNRLRQDRVMSMWFAWILWRDRGGTAVVDTETFQFKGLPWRPTNTGLVLPRGAR